MSRSTLLPIALVLLCPTLAAAQSMPGMDMPAVPATRPSARPEVKPRPQPEAKAEAAMIMAQPTTLIATELQHTSSGTSVEPPSTPMSVLMRMREGRSSGWTLMLHGSAFLADTQQQAQNDRGHDALFSTNWIMPMAQRKLGPGLLTLRTMLSLEPATIPHGLYPELFQQGETAANRPIVDGQHPHDFVMELAALYDLHLSDRTLLSLYAAPVGDPALGPTAYPHRASAAEDPIAALGHHQQDSTHIAFNVLTAGLTHGPFRLEVSGFHGAEPTEARWHFQPSPNGVTPDSVSTRLTWVPSPNWAAQYSIGHIIAPEALASTDNQRRQTASLMYTRPLGVHHDTTSMPGMDMGTPATGTWTNTALWGQTECLTTHTLEDSYLFESLITRHRDAIFTRIELAARTSELLHAPIEANIGHVQAYTLGYDRDYRIAPHLHAAPGAQYTQYRTPDSLAPTYGRTPYSLVAFLRLRIAN